jgi:hypothetical protein
MIINEVNIKNEVLKDSVLGRSSSLRDYNRIEPKYNSSLHIANKHKHGGVNNLNESITPEINSEDSSVSTKNDLRISPTFKGETIKDKYNYDYYKNESRIAKETGDRWANDARKDYDTASRCDPSKAASFLKLADDKMKKAQSYYTESRDKLNKANTYK